MKKKHKECFSALLQQAKQELSVADVMAPVLRNGAP